MYESNQEVFNTVAEHLIRQRRRSMIRAGRSNQETCAYRGEDGLRCAIGACVPDDVQFPEGRPISVVMLNWIEHYRLVFGPGVSIDLLKGLQDIHDQFGVDEWPLALKRIAAHYGLQLPPSLAATAPSETVPQAVTA